MLLLLSIKNMSLINFCKPSIIGNITVMSILSHCLVKVNMTFLSYKSKCDLYSLPGSFLLSH